MLGAEHRIKATNNVEFARWVANERSASNDWCATAYFYSALHLLDPLLHRYGHHPRKHTERNIALAALVRKGIVPREQEEHYQNLLSLSMTARYNAVAIDKDDLDDAINQDYLPLEVWLKGQLGMA